MRFAAITDIHGNVDALEAVLKDIAKRNVELTVNLGDVLSGPLWPSETADLLMPLGLPTIRGNHERQLITLDPEKMGDSDAYTIKMLRPEHLKWMESMPVTQWLNSEVFLCHGTPENDMAYFLEVVLAQDDCRAASAELVAERARDCAAKVILCGHTHMPRATRLEDGRLVVNPGSVGLPAISYNKPYQHIIASGSSEARYAILDNASGSWEAELLAVAYDWQRASAQAETNGRSAWARAISTGYM